MYGGGAELGIGEELEECVREFAGGRTHIDTTHVRSFRFLPFSGSCASWIGLVDRTVPATILHDATLHTFEMDTVARYDSAKCPKPGMTKRAFYIS